MDDKPETVPDESMRERLMTKSKIEDYLRTGLFITLMLLVFVAVFQLYGSIQSIIRIWFEYEYVPIFNSIYYAAVILLGLYLMKKYLAR